MQFAQAGRLDLCTMRWLPQILCLLALAAFAHAAHAQSQPVFRCIGAHGEPVFSGQPCGTPAAAVSNDAPAQAGGSSGICAASPQALRQSIADAFTRRDVNRLAGLILWHGMDQSSAHSAMRSLAEWLKQPLAGITSAYAAGPPPDDGAASATTTGQPASAASVATPAPSGFEISTGGGDGSRRDFGVVQSCGCWWLTF